MFVSEEEDPLCTVISHEIAEKAIKLFLMNLLNIHNKNVNFQNENALSLDSQKAYIGTHFDR